MAANKTIRFGPVALTTTLTTNIINCTITSLAGPVGYVQTQPYLLLKHIRIVNKTTTAATFSLWLGLTGANTAGTEVIGIALSVPPNQAFDWFSPVGLRMDAADFLVGGSATATALTFEAEGEIGLV